MTGHRSARIEQRIEVRAPAKRIFEVLVDPNQVPHYAARIEGADFVEKGQDGALVGSKIEMITTGGNILIATIKEAQPPRKISWEDERGLTSTWLVEPAGAHCVLTNILEGSLTQQQERKLAYDADVKFQALAKSLEEAGDEVVESEGVGEVAGTPRTPKKEN